MAGGRAALQTGVSKMDAYFSTCQRSAAAAAASHNFLRRFKNKTTGNKHLALGALVIKIMDSPTARQHLLMHGRLITPHRYNPHRPDATLSGCFCAPPALCIVRRPLLGPAPLVKCSPNHGAVASERIMAHNSALKLHQSATQTVHGTNKWTYPSSVDTQFGV